MPAYQEEIIFQEVITPDSIPVSPIFQSPTPEESSESDSCIHLEPPSNAIYQKIRIPLEQNLKELLQSITGLNNLENVTSVKLRVIARDICLQHLHIHTPQLTELNLDGSIVSSLRDLGCGLKNLKVLRVTRCSLESLDGVFGLQSLEELYASNNCIEDLSPCACLPQIRIIDLRRNSIKDITSVSFLTLCGNLEHLALDDNKEVIKSPQYRQVVKSHLPALKTLDDIQFNEEESSNCITYATQNVVDNVEPTLNDYTLPSTSSTKDCFLPPISPNKPYNNLSVRPHTARVNNSIGSPKEELFRPATARPEMLLNSAKGEKLPNIKKANDSRGQAVLSLLTSGPPICGNIGAALRNRYKNKEAWTEKASPKEENL